MIMRPLSITELSRVTGVAPNLIYAEIARGCLTATRCPGGGAWGFQVAWSVEPREAKRWEIAYKSNQRGRPGQRGGQQPGFRRVDHAVHRGNRALQ